VADGPHRDSSAEDPGRFSRAPWERDPYDDPPPQQRPRPSMAPPDQHSGPHRAGQDHPSGPQPVRRQQPSGAHPTGAPQGPGGPLGGPSGPHAKPGGPSGPHPKPGPGGPHATPDGAAVPYPKLSGPIAPGGPHGPPDGAGVPYPKLSGAIAPGGPVPRPLGPPPADLPAPRTRPGRTDRARADQTRSDQPRSRRPDPATDDDEADDRRLPGQQRSGWLVDDEVPIRPAEYFREVDAETGGTRLTEKKARQQRRTVSVSKIVAVVVAAAVVLATGVAWGARKWTDDKFRHVAALDQQSPSIVDAARQEGAENFLIVGSDTRTAAEATDEAADSVGDVEAVRGARSDTLLLAHIPADRSRLVMVFFPRDIQVDRPACETWDAKTGVYTGRRDEGEAGVKINTAYQIGGPRCATQVVQKLSGVGINHFISIDFAGFTAMTNTMAVEVGGLQVCVDRPLKDSFLGDIAAQPGPVDLTGSRALDFVRARHVDGDPTSDYGRIRRQQRFLAALVRGSLSGTVLSDPGKLETLVDALAANTFTDNVGVTDLLDLGESLRGVDAGKVTFVTVPTTGTANDRGNEELRTEDAAALFRAVIDGAAPPGAPTGEQPAPSEPGAAPPPSTVAPSEVKLRVLNGTGQGGLAGQVARELGDIGFEVTTVGNAPEQAPKTVIRYSAVKESHARTIAAAVPGAELLLDPSMGGALELVLGNGFDGEVTPVEAGRPAPDEPTDPPQGTPPTGSGAVTAADTSCA